MEITVRDQAWAIVRPVISNLNVSRPRRGARIAFHAAFESATVEVGIDAQIEMWASGMLEARVVAVAGRDFELNRIGLIVLHPMAAAGHHVVIGSPEGTSTRTFPRSLIAWPIATDISEMRWSPTSGLRAAIRMSGDLWEMEDQRNWSDASFKSYPGPLYRPRPIHVRAGAHLEQAVSLLVSGNPRRVTKERDQALIVRIPASARFTSIGIAGSVSPPTLDVASVQRLRDMQPAHLRGHANLSLGDGWSQVTAVATQALALETALELDVTLPRTDQAAVLRGVIDILKEIGVPLIAVHVFDPMSPSGFDSRLESLRVARSLMRASGLGFRVGGGTRANFTELARARIPSRAVDIMTFSISPQVHTSDDAALMETLSVQPVIAESARRLARGRPLSIVLSLRPRFNPYAGHHLEVVPADAMLPTIDPRQPTAFAAAWTVGTIKALARSGVERLTLFESVGMAGLMSDPSDSLHQDFPASPGTIYPLFGVVAAVCGLHSPALAAVDGGPSDVAAVAVAHAGGFRVLLANLANRERGVELVTPFGKDVACRVLALQPVHSEDLTWSLQPDVAASSRGRVSVTLAPFGVCRLDWVAGSLTTRESAPRALRTGTRTRNEL